MSIAARVVTLSRSFRSLIKTRAALAKHIKDLKDLSLLRVRACYRHSGPTDLKRTRDVFPVRGRWRGPVPRPTMKGRFFRRSAGACPPRALDYACTHDGEGNPLACACGNLRGPTPYGEGGPSAAADPVGAPPYRIKTGRSLLPGGHRFMKHPQKKLHFMQPFPRQFASLYSEANFFWRNHQ